MRTALDAVHTKAWKRKTGQSFGPFAFTWETRDEETVAALLKDVKLPVEEASFADICAKLAPICAQAPVARAIARMDRLRRVCGRHSFTAAQVTELVREAVRSQSRFGYGQHRGNLAMTIQRAKNREFQNVVVLWPHTVTGSPEHLRRLLYNGITRAMSYCSVIVFGHGRLGAPPFAPLAGR